jgi:hypothetical protein
MRYMKTTALMKDMRIMSIREMRSSLAEKNLWVACFVPFTESILPQLNRRGHGGPGPNFT